MKLTKALAASAAAIALTAAWGGAAMAQVTSSKLNGQVVDANGQAVTGATVTIIYIFIFKNFFQFYCNGYGEEKNQRKI